MTINDPAIQERLDDLLADQATQGLARAERFELDRLLRAHPEVDPLALDWTAAAIDLASIAPEPLPASLRAKAQKDAVAWLAREKGLRVIDSGESAAPAPARSVPHAPWWPWLLAAACVTIAAVAWWPNASLSPAEEYSRLASAAQAVPWTDVGGAGISGDMVWDNATQSGVMRFSGLAVNDPAKLQYQLWIFDAARGQLQTETGESFSAVDGGVFDVETAGSVVYVRVSAKLEVFEPTLFAITTEPAGGVVKHIETGDFRIILTASPPSTG